MRWFNIQPKLSKLQKEAQRKALKIYQSDPEKYKTTMFCPFCGEPLVDSGKTKALETLTEHVDCSEYISQKKVYICSSKGFYKDLMGCKNGIFWIWNGPEGWIESGGAYHSDFWSEIVKKESELDKVISHYLYSEQNSEQVSHWDALNSWECKSSIGIEHKGLPNRKDLLRIGRFILTLDFSYDADYFGRVNKTFIHLGYLWKEDNHTLVGIWPWRIWSWKIKDYRKCKKRAKKALGEDYYKNLLKAYCHSPNRSWSYRFFEKVNEFIHFWEVRKLKKHYNISKIPERFELGDIIKDGNY